ELMITLLNDNRSSGLSAAHAEPGVGKSIATALALQKCVEQSEAPFYRWSKEQAQKYLKTMTTLTKGVEEVLKMSEVPDKFGGWRPVSIKEYLRTGSAATQIKPVWVRQLEQDDEKFVQIGSSFKVQGELADVDDVKEAIAQKKPNTVSCDADEIDIYSQKEGGWVREDEEAAVNRGKSRADCYGFTLPGAAGVA
ncbi:unnamed protein product, partial [Effrenium voratum]